MASGCVTACVIFSQEMVQGMRLSATQDGSRISTHVFLYINMGRASLANTLFYEEASVVEGGSTSGSL